jgi:hypothetical protein
MSNRGFAVLEGSLTNEQDGLCMSSNERTYPLQPTHTSSQLRLSERKADVELREEKIRYGEVTKKKRRTLTSL